MTTHLAAAPPNGQVAARTEILSSRTVGTLAEVRVILRPAVGNPAATCRVNPDIGRAIDGNGTVPLPDGTVIEVRSADWTELGDDL